MNAPPARAFDLKAESPESALLTLNRDRLTRVLNSLPPHQRELVEALPLLFHINHPMLPGYVSRNTPCGISDYTPSDRAIRAAKRLSRSFDYDRRAAPRLWLHGLYMMGSPGTIAYSHSSDLDMWLIHAPDVDEEALDELHRKARLIENHAESQGLEVHFFIFDAERFRAGETLSLSDESSGSSQRYLLLDEFYRSGLLVAGRPPLWWRVPSCYDDHYEDFIAALVAARALRSDDYIDFGGLAGIPAAEFFGATVWQIYKSISSPYKSVMKLLLMEAYATEYPAMTLLSTRLKQNLESRSADLNSLDPYILMYTKTEEHLMALNDPTRLDVLRRCFYIKVNLPLSDPRTLARDDWRGEVMQHMVQAWGWTPTHTERFDKREQWGLEIAVEERRDINKTLKECYARLSNFARMHTRETDITSRDLTVLGRKLYAAFERKPAKIDMITRGICPDPAEPSLSVHEIPDDNGEAVWSLYPGSVLPQEAQFRRPIKRSASASEIVLWCVVNGLAAEHTNWHVFAGHSRLDVRTIGRMRAAFEAFLGDNEDPQSSDEKLAQPLITRALLLVNVGEDAFASTFSDGEVVTTEKNDPYVFGARRLNLVRALDFVYRTSWGEIYTFRYHGDDAVLRAIMQAHELRPRGNGTRADGARGRGAAEHTPFPLAVHCFGADVPNRIEQRVHDVFVDALNWISLPVARTVTRYIMQTGSRLLQLSARAGELALHEHESQTALIRELGARSSAERFRVRFDPACERAGLLPGLYAANRDGIIQVFAQPRSGSADVYVIDERGALLATRQDCDHARGLLEHYRRFIESAALQSPPIDFGDDNDSQCVRVETHEIRSTASGLSLRAVAPMDSMATFDPLRVVADCDEQGKPRFTIYFEEREFSTWEHGASLFGQVTEFILSRRRDGAPYPVYITDLELAMGFRRSADLPTVRAYDLLLYKQRIEMRLNRELHQLTGRNNAVADAGGS